MGLSIANISACRALLFTSLPNTVAPRWRLLTLLEAAQADFKAADHLTALATLSDEYLLTHSICEIWVWCMKISLSMRSSDQDYSLKVLQLTQQAPCQVHGTAE